MNGMNIANLVSLIDQGFAILISAQKTELNEL